IYVYHMVPYYIPENDSIDKTRELKNHPDSYYKDEILTVNYHKVLKKDSIVFLDLIFGEKSKTELVDTNANYYPFCMSHLMIVSGFDTIRFGQKEIVKKINEAWTIKNSNSSVKLKAREKSILIWEFKD
ncbi:hypothetical protein, partial [Candidatus Symbiothrix dinenymphae]|uniref:hypothetical protein n=1 Tax=Candidatus Symbiothrix dinenymphae TaxID=467085 RepID=UPI000AB61D6D